MNHETVKLISITPRAEETMAYCARVSNPKNQDNPEVSRLLGYCIQLRTKPDTQLEHREIALKCREIFAAHLPQASKALGWTKSNHQLMKEIRL